MVWQGWKVVGVGMIAFGAELIRRRVMDEEGMLRGSFGKEWEEWHGRTKRFIPFVF